VSAGWGGRLAASLTRVVLLTYGTTCHLCLEPGATSADHLVPRSRGGDDSLENLRPAHTLCNSRRGARSIEWFRERYAPDQTGRAATVDGLAFFKPAASGNATQARPFSPVQNKSGPAGHPIAPEVDAFFTDRRSA
jgi:hypothetical protein